MRVGGLLAEMPEETPLFMLSDHGFCTLKKQVYLNHYLQQEGLLHFTTQEPRTIADIDPQRTSAYCMDTGRIYLNIQGREPSGIVSPGAEAEALLPRPEGAIGELADPESGAPMVGRIVRGSDAFHGPLAASGPDLVVAPNRGYGFKGAVSQRTLTDVGIFSGMHTHDDGMLFVPQSVQAGDEPHIRGVAALIESMVHA